MFLHLLRNMLSASLVAGPSEYGAVNGGVIVTFITNYGLRSPIETIDEKYSFSRMGIYKSARCHLEHSHT